MSRTKDQYLQILDQEESAKLRLLGADQKTTSGPDQDRNIDYGNYCDVDAILDGGLPPAPTPKYGRRADGVALLYEQQVNMLFGDPEGGKTWVALAATADALINGERGLILDMDHNGVGATLARLLALGVPADTLRDRSRFLYVEPEDKLHVLTIVMDMATWQPHIVVVDSLGELIPLFGSSSNSADDFTLVHSRVLKPFAKSGACVVLIDHLSKGADSRAFGPGGTAAKRRAIGGVSIRVRVKDAFTPGQGGSAYLTVNKDRHGGLRKHCPTGDREPLAGIFKLSEYAGGLLEAEISAPKDGESAPKSFSISGSDSERAEADAAALNDLDPAPKSKRDVQDRMGWGSDRATEALRTWRNSRKEDQ